MNNEKGKIKTQNIKNEISIQTCIDEDILAEFLRKNRAVTVFYIVLLIVISIVFVSEFVFEMVERKMNLSEVNEL